MRKDELSDHILTCVDRCSVRESYGKIFFIFMIFDTADTHHAQMNLTFSCTLN